jgi:hypothetical protein
MLLEKRGPKYTTPLHWHVLPSKAHWFDEAALGMYERNFWNEMVGRSFARLPV